MCSLSSTTPTGGSSPPYTPLHSTLTSEWSTIKTKLTSLTPDLAQHAKLARETDNFPDNLAKITKAETNLADFERKEKRKVEEMVMEIEKMAEKQLDALSKVSSRNDEVRGGGRSIRGWLG